MPSPKKSYAGDREPGVAELGRLYEQEGAESVPTTGIWKGRHFLHHRIVSSSHVKWCNSKIDGAVSFSKLRFLLFPSLAAPMVRNLPLVSRLMYSWPFVSICPCANIVLSLTQDIYRPVMSSLTFNVVRLNKAIPFSFLLLSGVSIPKPSTLQTLSYTCSGRNSSVSSGGE